MLITKGLMRYTFLIPIVILILICSLAFQKVEESSSLDNEVPIYKIAISENTQRYIWKLCEENRLAYELVLAIYQIDGINNIQTDNIKAEIENLAYYRDYWAHQGYPDEMVFDLMLLSKQRGIEGCLITMEDNYSYDLDNYVKKVAEYKYYLEQSIDAQPPV